MSSWISWNNIVRLYLLIRLSSSISSLENGKHSCLYMYAAEDHFTDCNLDNTSLCDVKHCISEEKFCLAIYHNDSGKFIPDLMDCTYRHESIHSCLNNTCALELAGSTGFFRCCCFGHMCNANLVIPKPIYTREKEKVSTTETAKVASHNHNGGGTDSNLYFAIIGPTVLVLILAALATFILRRRKRNSDDSKHRLLEIKISSTTSVETSFSNVKFLDVIHRGETSYVMKGVFQQKYVAVKVLLEPAKSSWVNEKDVYENFLPDHENVLKFLNADPHMSGNSIEYWIITDFHSNGTLLQYLEQYTLDSSKLMQFLLTMINGISYLHDNKNYTSKPTIAHRDLKPGNIFIKEDLSCCIGDFGLAIVVNNETQVYKMPDMHQVGTKRYMAPEVLQGSIAFCWESLLQMDIYALALVMWEMVSRYEDETMISCGYSPSYDVEVGRHPNIGHMIKCVCEEKKRPLIKSEWSNHPILGGICESIIESWDEDAFARLSASCIYERISQIQREYQVEAKVCPLEPFNDTQL